MALGTTAPLALAQYANAAVAGLEDSEWVFVPKRSIRCRL
jgi:hypothetical protein|tara:strand:- start:457 stop:576 length:120 start_codon:yes stop_codon:yes gene_type:complete